MRHKLFQTVIVSVASLSVAGVLTAQTGDRLRIPAGFQHWYLVNSLLVTKDSPQFDTTGGLHHVYVNDIGLARLKKGGSAPYPDGTVFADDVREFSLFDGEYTEGKRKVIPVMLIAAPPLRLADALRMILTFVPLAVNQNPARVFETPS